MFSNKRRCLGVREPIFSKVLMLFFCNHLVAQNQKDSIKTATLREVVVTANRTNEIIPFQKLSGKELQRLNSHSVANAMRYFSGIQIKNYEEIFGSAGTIYLKTRCPKFVVNKNFNLRELFRTGSLNFINPSILWGKKISKTISSSFNAEYINSSGKYKFRYKKVLPNGTVAWEVTAINKGVVKIIVSPKNGLFTDTCLVTVTDNSIDLTIIESHLEPKAYYANGKLHLLDLNGYFGSIFSIHGQMKASFYVHSTKETHNINLSSEIYILKVQKQHAFKTF